MNRHITKTLLQSVAVAAIAVASPAVGQTSESPATEISPLYGNIGAFYGNIGAFDGLLDPEYGNIGAFYGNIGAFYGNIGAFYGNIGAFEGSLDPEYGNIGAFYGNIGAFDGTLDAQYGNIGAFYGNIGAFYGNIGAFYGNIGAFDGEIDPSYGNIGAFDGDGYAQVNLYWAQFSQHWDGKEDLWTNPLKALQLGAHFNDMISSTKALWQPRITAAGGGTFEAEFLNPLLARYGINRNNPLSMQALSASERAQFFVEWHDGLMEYSGADRIDHWMMGVNWSPSLTQQQGSGVDSIIGLLDATVDGDADISDNLGYSGGYNNALNAHGIGVASLMVGAHDGKGLMGIAPRASVVAYNPFDETNSAGWADVRTGILALAERNASVINMSLGVSGYTLHPEWGDIFFDAEVASATESRIFVMAAGNDGAVQPENVAWNFDLDPNLIIVGAVDPAGEISVISNTPGNACLMDGSACAERLKNRFMVAPGEFILLPDGQGGFVRRSGTSFAAPLVSGAITLLHDRWPWLAQHPDESVEIILSSARDLGAPGVDAVYGHGLLDVQASQSPLDFNNLEYYEVRNGQVVAKPASSLKGAGIDTTWETDGVYFQLYEPIGDTYRDFVVPVSSQLVGKVGTLTDAQEYLQQFAAGRLTDWLGGTLGATPFSDVASITSFVTPSLQVTTSSGRPYGDLMITSGRAPHTAMRIAGPGLAFTAGYGNGAMAMNAQEGLGLASDYGAQGGVNPMLGLASGGAFFGAELPVAGATSFSFGWTEQRLDHDRDRFLSDEQRAAYSGIADRRADAVNLRVTHRASESLSLSGSYARIRERNSLLGVQSHNIREMDRGAVTDTFTVASTLKVGEGVTFALSGTAGRTRSDQAPEQGFSTSGDVLSSSFAFSATFEDVVGRGDALRLSVAQPFHVESGDLAYTSVQVVDRTTGELGVASQTFGIDGNARGFTGELLYAAPILDQAGEIGLFGRAELQSGGNADVNQMAAGARISVRF